LVNLFHGKIQETREREMNEKKKNNRENDPRILLTKLKKKFAESEHQETSKSRRNFNNIFEVQ
jgi:hypothetical protein